MVFSGKLEFYNVLNLLILAFNINFLYFFSHLLLFKGTAALSIGHHSNIYYLFLHII